MAGQLLRTAAFAAALLGIVAASSALGSRQVVGGVPADVRSAPWTVLVAHGSLTESAYCTGAILDPLHVLTAGHCVYDSSGGVASAHTFLVRAGVTNAITPSSTDATQDRGPARPARGSHWP